MQAATDPVFPNKWSGSPLQRNPTNLEGWKPIGISLEELQPFGAKKLKKKCSEWGNLSTEVIPLR